MFSSVLYEVFTVVLSADLSGHMWTESSGFDLNLGYSRLPGWRNGEEFNPGALS